MQRTSNTNATIYVNLLGEFSIRSGGKEVHENLARTHQLWHLLEFLVANRHREISQDEIISVLWPDSSIDNPSNALKNLVYRVRTTLSSHGLPYSKEMIVYTPNGYRWNNSLPCEVDTEEFEKVYEQAERSDLPASKRVKHYLDAIDIYDGDFLYNVQFEPWVVPIATNYRNMFFNCVYKAIEMLTAEERYHEIELLCYKAIEINKFEEAVHRQLIVSLVKQGKQTDALGHYSSVTNLFFRELGIRPSSAMRSLYRDIAKKVHDVEFDLAVIQEDLEESDRIVGAFYCEYEVFKHLYRLEARTAARSGLSVFLSLITIEDNSGNILSSKVQNKMMDSLYEIVETSLRQGDVFARFSGSQYVLLLSALSFENCSMVMQRIVKRFNTAHRSKDVSISTKELPMDPILSE